MASDRTRAGMLNELVGLSSTLRASESIGPLRQLARLMKFRRQAGIGLSEFFELELFDSSRFDRPERCVGHKRSRDLDRLLNSDGWRAMVNDKLVTAALLHDHGLPTTTTIGVYRAGAEMSDARVTHRTAEDLHDLFASCQDWPLFAKPVAGTYGRGTFRLAGYDATQRCLMTHDGQCMPLPGLVAAASNPKFCGLLIQKMLRPHAEVQRVAGRATSCVRMIIVRDDDMPHVHRACWKIARTRNITDNFANGRDGNLVAAVDARRGRVGRVVGAVWPNSAHDGHHPDTGERLTGFTLPDWAKARQLVCRASSLFPGLRLQNWDVAFCDSGPVLLECNTESDLGIAQLVDGRPFIDRRFEQLIARRAAAVAAWSKRTGGH